MKGMCDEDNPYDSKEKLSIEERNTSEDIVDHDSGDLQVYTQEGKHNIQEEDIVYVCFCRRHTESIDQEIFEINKKRRDNFLWLEKKAEKK